MNSPSRPATPQDIDLAYRLLLGRPADADGLAHYGQRITEGLTLNALTSELLNSSEFRDKAGLPNAADVDAVTVEPTTATDLITPRQVLAQYTLDELNETADEYYRRLPDVTPFMAKPFAFLNETPEILENLGLLLAELELGR